MKFLYLMMKFLYLILIGFSLIACKSETKDKVSDKNISNLKFSAFCFYEQDEKYKLDSFDSIKLENWIAKKTHLILNQSISNDLFSHSGGGPNGAEWNGGTNIFIAVYLPEKSIQEKCSVIINDLILPETSSIIENVNWYKVEEDYWYSLLRPIKKSDFKLLYSKDQIAHLPIASLITGEVNVVKIQYGIDTLTKYFHVAFGE